MERRSRHWESRAWGGERSLERQMDRQSALSSLLSTRKAGGPHSVEHIAGKQSVLRKPIRAVCTPGLEQMHRTVISDAGLEEKGRIQCREQEPAAQEHCPGRVLWVAGPGPVPLRQSWSILGGSLFTKYRK